MIGAATLRSGFETALRIVYPPHCLACNEIVGSQGGLCGKCWAQTPFISGLTCDLCGTPLPGEEAEGGIVHCDDCLRIARPWTRGRAALIYRDSARRLILGFKHGDRTEIARAAGQWMATAAQEIRLPGQIVVPTPLHWQRLFARRYNQAALLAAETARCLGLSHCPDLLERYRHTGTQEGKGAMARFDNLADAIRVNPRHAARIRGRPVLLVDDVFTSGATLAACADACLSAGADDVRVLALARVVKDG